MHSAEFWLVQYCFVAKGMSCYLYFFCLPCCFINIHIFDYPDSRLSGLFTEVPTSPDNRGSTVIGNLLNVTTCNHGHICHFLQVDSHNIIPCWQASPKLEYGARTIRPKIHNQMREFLTEFPPVIKHPHAGKASIKVTSYFWNSL